MNRFSFFLIAKVSFLGIVFITTWSCDVTTSRKKEITKVANAENRSMHDFLPSSTTNQVIKHTYFTLSYNEENEQAEWVAYRLLKENINGPVSRTEDFRIDPDVKTGSADLEDYRGSGYDRGHLVPAGAMKQNITAMSETFYMSNMTPQVPEFNGGMWHKLEKQIRTWVQKNDSIFVITGPIFSNPIGVIGANNVTIPRYYYKVVVSYRNGQSKGIGFIMANEILQGSVFKYAVTIDEIEEQSGIDFFQNYSIESQTILEGTINLKEWR
jgi:endonuclease G